jgi:hypothetical protein
LPAARAKNKREPRIYLVPSVQGALIRLTHEGRYAFERGRRWLMQGDWFRDALKWAGIEGARFHDLRRTASTFMNRIGIDSRVVERILNHKVMGDVEATYNVYQYDSEKRAALLRWERRLNGIIAGEAGENVVPFQVRQSKREILPYRNNPRPGPTQISCILIAFAKGLHRSLETAVLVDK